MEPIRISRSALRRIKEEMQLRTGKEVPRLGTGDVTGEDDIRDFLVARQVLKQDPENAAALEVVKVFEESLATGTPMVTLSVFDLPENVEVVD